MNLLAPPEVTTDMVDGWIGPLEFRLNVGMHPNLPGAVRCWVVWYDIFEGRNCKMMHESSCNTNSASGLENPSVSVEFAMMRHFGHKPIINSSTCTIDRPWPFVFVSLEQDLLFHL